MKKFIWLLFVLIPFLSYASGPSVLVQGTATGTTQLRLSTVDGTAFLDTDGTVPCTSFIGEKIEIVDSAGKKISGFVKAAGDGEDLDIEKFTDPIYENDAAWTIGSGWTVNAAASGKAEATTSTANLTEALTYTAGALYKLVTNCDALTGGTYQAIIEGTNIGTAVNTTAAVSWYRTASAATSATNGTKATTSLSATFTAISLKKVTAPSSTGCTIVSTSGGATYNWNIKETGFNPNSATFTYRILSTNIPGKEVYSKTISSSDVKIATVDGGAMVEIANFDFSDLLSDAALLRLSPILWLRAEDLTATLGDGDAVTTWTDKMGSYNATQSTADNKPTLQTSEINGKAVVRFDGSNDHLDATRPISGTSSFTVFTVRKNVGGSGGKTTFSWGSDSTTGGYDHHYGSSKWGASWGSSNSIVYPTQTEDTTNFYIINSMYNGSYHSIWKNGVLGSTASKSNSNFTSGTMVIGDWINGNNAWSGDMAEIIIFNRALSDAERNQVEKSLSAYYGITLASSNPVPSSFVGDDAGGPVTIINPKSTSAATMTSNKYLLALYDSNGRVATGYIGASGGGETLGAEIATGTLTAGKLYKITATEANHFYTGCAIGEYFTSVGTETCDASNKVQEVTEVEATGLHGHSTPNATDRKMSLKTTGFDPNAITKYKIYRTY